MASPAQSGGLTLLEAPGARAAALGEAFSAMPDDVTAVAYNPAALVSLTRSQASVAYESGPVDDSYGRVDAAIPGFGISAAHYTAGRVDLLENGVTRSVDAQTDLSLSIGAARRLGRLSVGLSVKYLSSVLAEADRASAWAGDAGLLVPIGPVRAGLGVQNLGSKLTYVSDGDPLPRIARAGLMVPFRIHRSDVRLTAEAPYLMNEKEWRPAAGAEVLIGPMALRAGYRTGAQLEGVTLGAGFALASLTLDYSFGFVQNLNARQRVTLGFRFGGVPADHSAFSGNDVAYERRQAARRAAAGDETPYRRPTIGGRP